MTDKPRIEIPRQPTPHAATATNHTRRPDSSVNAATGNVNAAADVHPDSTSRLREVQDHETQHDDFEEMVDGKCFLDRSAERVQSNQDHQCDCRRGEIHRGSYAQGAREEQNCCDEQKRVKAAINEPVMTAALRGRTEP